MLWTMKTTTVVIIVAAAFVVGAVGALLIRQGQQAATGLSGAGPATPGDADGDGVTDEFDYEPNNPAR
jgi:hypothetical protein